jgi:hypothetical protein
MADRNREGPETSEGEPIEPLANEDELEDELGDELGGEPARLDLDDDERLPWLESVDDEDDYDRPDSSRLVIFLIAGLVVLAALVGGIWWATHLGGRDELLADGRVIEAPGTPYKELPKDAGGKTFAGTGDSAYAVSEGQTRAPRLGQGGEVVAPAADPAKTADKTPGKAGAPPSPVPTGVGVQVAAYTSLATAEAGWTRLNQQHGELLSGLQHRIVEGRADIGTVYRLQAMASDSKGANELCARLKAAGVACQVKN